MPNLLVKKSGGDMEPFDPSKLVNSLQRAGAREEVIKNVVSEVSSSLREGMSTHDIYKKAFSLLRKQSRAVAARYSLKRAILELGPSGFPFEDFLAEVLRHKGYKVLTRQTVRGLCAEHETDLVMEKDGQHIIAEAKFHNQLGLKSDLKVALYVNARVEDVRRGPLGPDTVGWLITNTKFTKSAVAYANCVKLNIIGWGYPRYGNLQDLIDEAGAHPVTALTSLTKSEKNELINKGVVLCRAVADSGEHLRSLNVSDRRIKEILTESSTVCRGKF